MNYKLKTIDIQAKEWFDKANANSYFSARVTLNYGMKDAEQIVLKFQYGYGDQYAHSSFIRLNDLGFTDINRNSQKFHEYCKEKGIILRMNKQEKCTRKDVESFGSIASTTDRIDNFKA